MSAKHRRWTIIHAVIIAAILSVGDSAIGDSDPSRCTTCWQMTHCSVLNGLGLPDPVIGYTRDATQQLEKQGVCEDIDKAVTLLTVFGGKYQYKDTPACRSLVYSLNCLSWGSKNNLCINAPRPPCRSLCVQIADECVFKNLYQLYLTQVCSKIPCTEEPTENCVPGENEQLQNYNRCTLHEDYLNLVLSSSYRRFISPTLIGLFLLSLAVWF